MTSPAQAATPNPLALFEPGSARPGWLLARWIFLRGLGLIFLSAFYSLALQICGLIGTRGILPASDYLAAIASTVRAPLRWWIAPTLFWLRADDTALLVVVALGIAASILLIVNVAPKASVAACTVLFMSCVAALQDFSSYQSDGMLLEAGFMSIFFAPRGSMPRLGMHDPPSRASLFLLQWEWFRIYFESGVAKLASGDPTWRNLTAMDKYYENAPFPTWIGWYAQHLPHAFHASTAALTLVVELVIVWCLFLPRAFRVACFAVASALQIGIIATGNYAFLNYLVLLLGVLLLDDVAMARLHRPHPSLPAVEKAAPWRTAVAAVALTWVFVATLTTLLPTEAPSLLAAPAEALEPFRIANGYGLFAVMTQQRDEIEFQGTTDGRAWIAYPFRYQPQRLNARPSIFAPYQPRFDWNLWFASLEPWRASTWVVVAQQRLLEGSPEVLQLFARNPFPNRRPVAVRTVLWRYSFTDMATRRGTGAWWRRELLGAFSGILSRSGDSYMLSQAP